MPLSRDGLATFTRHWNEQQQSLSSSNEQERMIRLYKGLIDAKTRLDQVTLDDSKYPDLYDQLSLQSESQNYYLEPYATKWCPQLIKKGNLIPLPTVIATLLETELQALTLSGLLQEIDHAWTSIDHRLFLWNYKQRPHGNGSHRSFSVFEMDQPIVAVALCITPRIGIFTDKVKHILVVATTVEIVLIAILYEDNVSISSGLRLQRTKLSVSTDNTVVRRICTTQQTGRIFFGGSDGGVYELLYGANSSNGITSSFSSTGFDTSLFIPSFLQRRNCRKITHTSHFANYLPSFLSALTTSPGKIIEFTMDHERQILYALHEQGDIDVFDLGIDGNSMTLVCTLNLLEGGAKYARENRRTRVSCPDERIFQSSATCKIVSLSVVDRTESALVNLVAMTTNGIRFYLTVYSRRVYTTGMSIPPTKRPTRLEILFIRLPPPAISLADAPPYHAKEGMQPGLAPGKSPSTVHVAFHRHGVVLMVDGAKDQQDRIVGIAHDPITSWIPATAVRGKPTMRESVGLESCIGKIVDVQELEEESSLLTMTSRRQQPTTLAAGSKRSYDDMSNGFNSSVSGEDMVPIVSEMTLQYSQPSRHFLCLSNAGIQVFKKVRPIDQLHRVLVLTRGTSSDLKATLAPFIRSFGEIQVCCMLIGLACGVQSDPLLTEGTSAAVAAVAANTSRTHPVGVKSDEYIFTIALQGIFECGQISRQTNTTNSLPTTTSANTASTSVSNTRIVLMTEFGMSYQHDGLVMFMTRTLRPLWYSRYLGRRTTSTTSKGAPPTVTYSLVHSTQTLDEIREVLFQLRQLMESAGPYAVSINSGAMLENGSYMDVIDGIENGGTSTSNGSSRTAELAERYHKQRNEEQQKREMRFKAERRSLFFMYQLVLRSIEAISLLRFTIDYQIPLEESFARLSFGDLVSTAEGAAAAKAMIKALLKGRNENNQFLVKQLREQCGSYFSVADVWHYQGYKSLAMAKISGPSQGRKTLLKESLNQFLNACSMWDTSDCIDVLQDICEDYAMLQFYEGVVKLSLACAKHFHDAATSDLSGVKVTLKRNCLGCILLSLQRLLSCQESRSFTNQSPQVEEMVALDDVSRQKCVDEILHYALASEDSEFHELLYSWLYEQGHTQMLIAIRSPFIESFLKDRDQDLLIKMYMHQQKYLVAAKVWWNRAHEDCESNGTGPLENNPDIIKRQYYVSKSLGCLQSIQDVGEAMDAIREVRDVLDVLQLQVRVLKALEQTVGELEVIHAENNATNAAELRDRKHDVKLLTYRMYDPSTLYNQFASKYDMWTECLHIIHACSSEDADVIETLWRKIIFDVVPPSTSSSEFNTWRIEQCELAGLPPMQTSSAGAAPLESDYWIGQLQVKVLRLGKALYGENQDVRSSMLNTLAFPVRFLSKQLEQIALWHMQVTHRSADISSNGFVDPGALNWVLKVFFEVGVPHRVLLSYYEGLYREQGSSEWNLNILRSIYTIVVQWKRHALSPRVDKDELAEYAACCPQLVAMCDDVLTDSRALGQSEEMKTMIDQFRRHKNELLIFRDTL